MKCPKCKNEDLRFVNATVQAGKDFLLLKIVLALSGFCALIMLFATIGFLSTLSGDPKNHWEALFAYPAAKAFVYFFTAFFSDLILMKLIPYKTKNEIRVICPRCGHVEELNSLIQKQKHEADDNEETELQIPKENYLFERPSKFTVITTGIIILVFITLIIFIASHAN